MSTSSPGLPGGGVRSLALSLQVHPGAEHPVARAGEHDHLHRVVGFRVGERGADPALRGAVERVRSLGPVDRDEPDCTM